MESSLPNLLGSYVPTFLADNVQGSLDWNRQNPPDPNYIRVGCIGDGSCFFHAAVKSLAQIYQLSYHKYQVVTEEYIQGFENSIQKQNLFKPRIFSPVRSGKIPGAQYTITDQAAYEKSMQTFRSIFVRLLRQEIAQKLTTDQRLRDIVARQLVGEINFQKDTITIQYNEYITNILESGQELTIQIPDEQQIYQQAFNIVINDLITELRSLDSVDARYALILSDYYNVDIYVITDKDLRDKNSKNSILSLYYNSAVQGPRNMRLPNDPNGQNPSRPSLIIINVNGGHFEIVGKIDNESKSIITSFNSGDPLIRKLYEILLDIRSANEIT
jgi:hypothetical protein